MKIRSFIAFSINDEIKEKIGDLILMLRKINADIRWVSPSNLHLTLKFLGYIDPEQVKPLSNRIGEIAERYEPFTFSLAGIGVFPDMKRPRVVWIGIREYDQILKIYKDLEKSMETEGFVPESRPLSPHITIGRARSLKGIDKLMPELVKYKAADFGIQVAESIFLMESTLKPGGAEYSSLHEARLRRK